MKTSPRSRFVPALALASAALASPSGAELLVYEPFDYPDAPLTGNGGALGTVGTWLTNDTNFSEGWWVHPGEATSGVMTSGSPVPVSENAFDGTADNLVTSGGYVGMAGPTDQPGGVAGVRKQTGNLDGHIGLDPSVTATFRTGTTTWFSYLAARADDRNEGCPALMLCTDPTVNGSRNLDLQNNGNGIGAGGGPPRSNLLDVYPQYFENGETEQTPGGYNGSAGTFGTHDGQVRVFGSGNNIYEVGTLDEVGQARTQTMPFADLNPDGTFGAPNIIIGKIEWDADTGGEDIISVVRFLESEALTEAAFDAVIAELPALSSANWASNKPNLDQSEFDLINISSLKFFVDEIRIGTTFEDVIRGGVVPKARTQLTITEDEGDLMIEWPSEAGRRYNVRSTTDPSLTPLTAWPIFEGSADLRATPPTNSISTGRPVDPVRFFVVEEFPAPPVTLFSEAFDAATAGVLPAGWSSGFDPGDTLMNTSWALGDPSGGSFTGPIAAFSAPHCVGTNISGDYGINSDTWLRTPEINLTDAAGATLTFQHWVDIDDLNDADGGSIRILEAGTLAELAVLETGLNGFGALDWEEYSKDLPPAALGQPVILEFRFVSDGDGFPGAGWYLDNLVVTIPGS